jgi:hypothetical protein
MDSDAAHRTFFAVTSLGKGRWYWVVRPSLEMVQSGESGSHVAEGYKREDRGGRPRAGDSGDARGVGRGEIRQGISS